MADDLGICVFCLIALDFFYALVATDNLRKEFTFTSIEEDFKFDTVGTVYALLSVFVLSMVYVYDKAQQLGKILYEKFISQNSEENNKILFATLHRLQSSPPGFNLAGMCVINRAFVGTMIGLFATYVLLTWDK
ncbi:uncharacterized protein LOC129594709 [Paramacrobiotus metropolitanus]|uniref:uncharacterized protein LOC129594709 n=1 Tax=Paramacrobiotus metropolitanus TaxID=2943436 RepID=UPI002445F6EC|nr:uncharacterized protein LOC129594709 [Paramacrobiotus metropolitanus]